MGNIKKENKLEKIYTLEPLINFLFEKVNEHYKGEITEFLEPAAGSGNIIDFLKKKVDIPVLSYDIYNETNRGDIIQSDFLKQPIEYKKGRVCIMNPPFHKATKFIYKCLEVSDYVVSITGTTTILSLDYEKVEADEIFVIKKQPFWNQIENREHLVDVSILCLRKKD